MVLNELVEILKKAYFNAGDGRKVLNVHLFALQYADEIQIGELTIDELTKKAGIPYYSTEIQSMINIKKYVRLKRRYILPI